MLVDRERHFVQVPLFATSRMAPTKLACQQRAELAAPQPDGLLADLDAPFGEQFLDIAVAEQEAVVQPDRVSDDLGRETVASERRDERGASGHEPILLGPPPQLVNAVRIFRSVVLGRHRRGTTPFEQVELHDERKVERTTQ
jgi:hypothetical protein